MNLVILHTISPFTEFAVQGSFFTRSRSPLLQASNNSLLGSADPELSVSPEKRRSDMDKLGAESGKCGIHTTPKA